VHVLAPLVPEVDFLASSTPYRYTAVPTCPVVLLILPPSMDEDAQIMANRDEPVPVLNISKPRPQRDGSPDSAHSRSSSQSKNSIQDRLFAKYVSLAGVASSALVSYKEGFADR
jgi:hypothetical protein